jgi:hypothetical protein
MGQGSFTFMAFESPARSRQAGPHSKRSAWMGSSRAAFVAG